MITHTLAPLRPFAISHELESWLHRAAAWSQETCCGLHGHDLLLHFESRRMFLKCASCGRETAGWRLDAGARRV